ncbi:hypothetical protein K470DRAFT_258347 [Piedraia hortae CBS 480.64]|uniref:Uncharacterized protein n=1 Tax=Piedraia hortae CBS 480.64 TaxID=1314780 RepID=A0A6A7BZS2_9PEZI|nr:hypothetical protein K470DRAFT_258347 [Piedraia hortae CBS 480.64]
MGTKTPIEQLEKELGNMLIQLGRMLSAAARGERTTSAADATRLKRDLPGYSGRFHSALDSLQTDVSNAMLAVHSELSELAPTEFEAHLTEAHDIPEISDVDMDGTQGNFDVMGDFDDFMNFDFEDLGNIGDDLTDGNDHQFSF